MCEQTAEPNEDGQVIHDISTAAGVSILEVFKYMLREEEERDAFGEIYVRVVAALQAYQIKSKCAAERMQPSRN